MHACTCTCFTTNIAIILEDSPTQVGQMTISYVFYDYCSPKSVVYIQVYSRQVAIVPRHTSQCLPILMHSVDRISDVHILPAGQYLHGNKRDASKVQALPFVHTGRSGPAKSKKENVWSVLLSLFFAR